MFTMRRGLENSINLVTAHLLANGIISLLFISGVNESDRRTK